MASVNVINGVEAAIDQAENSVSLFACSTLVTCDDDIRILFYIR